MATQTNRTTKDRCPGCGSTVTILQVAKRRGQWFFRWSASKWRWVNLAPEFTQQHTFRQIKATFEARDCGYPCRVVRVTA